MKKQAYYMCDEKEGTDYDEVYSMLRGPDKFECLLTEPEDRIWYRDLQVVVDKLNEQHDLIETLMSLLDRVNTSNNPRC